MPYYPLETRVPDRPFSASCEERRTQRDLAWYESEPAIQWTRCADGSTEITITMPLYLGLVIIETHFVSDVPRRTIYGYAEISGALASLVSGESPRLTNGKFLANGVDGIEQAPLQLGDREDGSPRKKGRQIELGGVAVWTFDDFVAGPSSNDALEIDGRAWPATTRSFRSPDERGDLEVWISDDLGVVLKEELWVEGELQRSYRMVSIEEGHCPKPSLPVVQQ